MYRTLWIETKIPANLTQDQFKESLRLTLHHLYQLFQNEQLEIAFDEFEQCSEKPDTPLSYEDVQVEFVGIRDVVIDGKVTLTEVIPEKLKVCYIYLCYLLRNIIYLINLCCKLLYNYSTFNINYKNLK